MIWPKTTITTDSGERREAIAPLIVSVSRSTDIPAFHGRWFMDRLDAGYIRWINPWSGKPLYVSLENVRFIVFWTKNPKPFLPFLERIESKKIGFYFHFTLNDYEREGLEPGLPPLSERIETFRLLANTVGRERVFWRFDPLLITPALQIPELAARVQMIGDRIGSSTDRLTVSFIDIYAKVKRNLAKAGIDLLPWGELAGKEILQRIGDLTRQWGIKGLTCAEPASSAVDPGAIAPGRCIDPDAIMRIAEGDAVLREFLLSKGMGKDSGQRQWCGCIMSKDIGRYDTCAHGCVYCYANTSPAAAEKNCARSNPGSDAII